MEMLIMRVLCDKMGYGKTFYDNTKMYHLGEFLSFHEIGFKTVLEWIEDPADIHTETMNLELESGIVRIYSDFFDYSIEESLYYYENAFKTTFDKFVEILEKWKEIRHKKPSFVVIKKIDDDVFFEEEYHDDIDFDLFKAKLTEASCKHIFEPNIKDGKFYGGFHFQNCDNKIEMCNKQFGRKNVLSFDIKFDKDFTFNHAFFPSDWDKEILRQEIVDIFRDYQIDNMQDVKKFSSKRGEFFIVEVIASPMLPVRMVLNKKLEVVSCYPLFRKL